MVAVISLSEERHRQAQARLDMLRPHLEEGVSLTRAAAKAGIPLRTAQRWLTRYREDDPAGSERPVAALSGAER